MTQRTFNSGELAPELHKRAELARYYSGLAIARNVFVMTRGGVQNRWGTKFGAETKDSTKTFRLIDFNFFSQTYTLELGDQYMRVFSGGGRVVLSGTPAAYNGATTYSIADHVSYGGVNYYSRVDANLGNQPDISPTQWYALTDEIVEIPTSWAMADLMALDYTQKGDVITVTHRGYVIAEIIRLANDQWKIQAKALVPTIQPPTGVGAAQNYGSGGPSADTRTYTYAVTSIDDDTGEESLISATASAVNNFTFQVGDYNRITWLAATGAGSYRVYKQKDGSWGFIGDTPNLQFDDDNIVEDLTDGPPEDLSLFASAGNYPGCVELFEQRMFFGSTTNQPRTIWGSRSAQTSNFLSASPATDSDSIEFTLESKWANQINFLAPALYMVAITDRGAHVIRGQDNYLTPTSPPDIKMQGTAGSAVIGPVVVNTSLMYVEDTGRRVYEVDYDTISGGFQNHDRTVLSEHLLEDYGIVDWCYASAPHQVLWAVREDGALLSFTYHAEHEVFGWCRHDTDGEVETITCIREGNVDVVYLGVKRTINGATKRYIETMGERKFATLADAFFVDCGLTYSGAAATTITGLSHLEGKAVAVLADGFVREGLTVSSGQITLPIAASKVHVGLPYVSEIETLEIDSPDDSKIGDSLSVSKVTVCVMNSRGGKVTTSGYDDDYVSLLRDADTATLTSEDIQMTPLSGWDYKGKVKIKQDQPLPLTVLAIKPEIVGSTL